MENLDVFGALRRWYGLVIAGAIVGALAGYLVGPPSTTPAGTTYEAVHVLLVEDSAAPEREAELIAFLATIGDVPQRVASRIGAEATAQDVTGAVAVESNNVGMITITAESRDPVEAVALADGFGQEIIAERRDDALAAYDERLDALTTELENLSGRATELQTALTAGPGDRSLAAQLDGVLAQTAALSEEREAIASERAQARVPLRSVQSAIALTQPADGIEIPFGRLGTAAIGGLVGLILGALLAVVMARYDPRLYDRAQIERTYGFPVIATIPMLPRPWRRRRDVITTAEPASPAAEAYRRLRTTVERLLGQPESTRPLRRPARAASSRASRSGAVVLVTSALPSEGKTTLVANLAATYAQSGRSVVVVSADLRSPNVNEFLDVAPDRGLADIFAGSPAVEDLLRPTSIAGVRLVLDGSRRRAVEQAPHDGAGPTSPASPGDVLERARSTISDLRRVADIVLIDTPPLLPFNDVGELLPAVDGVIVVARVGAVTLDDGHRTHEVLEQLGAEVLGLVLVAVPTDGQVAAYYSRSGGRRRRSAAQTASASPDDPARAGEIPANGNGNGTGHGAAVVATTSTRSLGGNGAERSADPTG
jgi:Mrp family chromosome partitioning ATPase